MGNILKNNNIDIVLVQETHLVDETKARMRTKIAGYDIIGITYHHTYGLITYASNDIENIKLITTSTDDDIHIIVVRVEDMNIVNVYKPHQLIGPRTYFRPYLTQPCTLEILTATIPTGSITKMITIAKY